MNKHKKNFAVFISGSGTNFEAVQKNINQKKFNASIKLLISSNPNALALKKAEKYNIDSFIIQQKNYTIYNDYVNEILKTLKRYNIDYIILAGFLKKIPEKIIKHYKMKIINVHPALLPKFGGKGMYGIHVHEAVINAKEKETGATVHFVDEKYDHGPIIMQKKFKVLDTDTPLILQKRVLKGEHQILPYAVKLLCEEKIKIKNNKVIID